MVYIIFGVSGVGKTTIGRKLSDALNIPFYDADDFHPKTNIDKMQNGNPLNDSDRSPWLEKIGRNIIKWNKTKGAVLACSALKESYRDLLKTVDKTSLEWIFLYTEMELISDRLKKRSNHFFNVNMLQSQYNALEVPKYGLHVDVNQSQENIIHKIIQHMKKQTFGLIGLGVMGKSLALNIAGKGTEISVFNRQVKGVEVDVAKNFVKDFDDLFMKGFDNLKSFVISLQKPRSILIMVNAGKAVDAVIEDLIPILDKGDIIIDGGNSHFLNTKRRIDYLRSKGLEFIGMGVSGGEEGALKGPSIMPSGSKEAYLGVASILEGISAKDREGNNCCTFIGPEGAGHFIKMIHNGIEYGEMQIIAEVYHLLRFHCKKQPLEIADVFENWQSNDLSSYLLGITIDILHKKEGDEFLIDKILDQASQKGTGGWSTNAALELGKPLNTIAESVMARFISAMKSTRKKAASIYGAFHKKKIDIDLNKLKSAYAASRIVNHAIGFDTIREASIQNNWNLNLSEISRIWTNGCIIRSEFMEELVLSFKESKDHLLIHKNIAEEMRLKIPDYSEIIGQVLGAGCTIPVMSSGLNYLLGFISEQSSANLIQAQRDYFGAHTYERVDKPKGEYFHTEWKLEE